MAEVVAVCVSDIKGIQKRPVEQITLKKRHGIVGDAHAGDWHRQVSLLGEESVDKMRRLLPELGAGAFAENILTRGITLYELPVGTKLRVGGVLLQITQIGKECHQGCAIRKLTGDCVMPREGVFAVVLEEGVIHPGDRVVICNSSGLNTAAVITVSDKGSQGLREDTGGPLVCRILKCAGYEIIHTAIVPDERSLIEQALIRTADELDAALCVTTGGTGFSPRDVTPEATLAVCERMAPGIPEAMRAASLKVTDRGMLSRAQAGIRGRTLIINLPGNPKAVNENLEVILPALGHGLEMLRGEKRDCAVPGEA